MFYYVITWSARRFGGGESLAFGATSGDVDDSTDAGVARRRRRHRQRFKMQRDLDEEEEERRIGDLERRLKSRGPDPLEATLPFVVMSMVLAGFYQTEIGYKVLRPAGPYVLPFLFLPPIFVGLVYAAEWLYNLNLWGPSEEDDIEDMLSDEEEELQAEEEEEEEEEGEEERDAAGAARAGAGELALVEEEEEVEEEAEEK